MLAAPMTNEQAVREQARQAVHQAVSDGARRDDLDGVQRKVQRVLDAQLALTPRASRSQVACAKGCAMCCHLRVMATPAEVFALVGYMRRQLDQDAFEMRAARIASVAAQVHGLPRERLLLTNIACPLLVDGACSMYPARPFNCRAYHSLDYDACLASFEHPADTSLSHPQSALQARVHEGVQQGFLDVLRKVNVDSSQYELVTALDEALQDPQAEQRFARGDAVFRRALRL